MADIGAVRTKSCNELLYARQKLVTCAKAYGLQAIDLVHIDYKDLDGLAEKSLEGANMGFTGKQVCLQIVVYILYFAISRVFSQVIHPTQIPVVHKSFSPSPEKMEWATELIKAFRNHEESGKGAFTFRNSMIDMPLVKQAENIVIMSEKINKDRG